MLECFVCIPTLEFVTRINNMTCNNQKEQNNISYIFQATFYILIYSLSSSISNG
jgi:hypothetical protein